jgi:hypothetical protein
MSWKDKGMPVAYGYKGIATDEYGWWRRWCGGRHSPYGFWRHPKTTQERRLWDDEYGRTRRSPRRLPNAYDDVCRCFQRSWKEHRRTQYKPLD